MAFDLPFVSRGKYREVQLENYTLRDALRNANDEIMRYRMLVSSLPAEPLRQLDPSFQKKVVR